MPRWGTFCICTRFTNGSPSGLVNCHVSRFVLGVLAGVTLAAAASVATVAVARERGWSLPGLRSLDREPGPVTVVLHRDGGSVHAAHKDDPGQRLSGILQRQQLAAVDLPPFRGTDREWDTLVGCVRDRFDGLAVNIVDTPPSTGPYTLAFVGGTPELLAYPPTVGGIAPHADRVLESSVLFVFQPPGVLPRSLCETTAHEVGHTLGLDHSRDCTDIMSYESCGPKEFRDGPVACGEWEDRTCEDGESTQDARAQLLAAVGSRPLAPTVEPPRPTVSVATHRPHLDVRRSADAFAGAPFSVIVDVGDVSVEHVDLFWYARGKSRLRCGEDGPVPFTCHRDGSVYTFTLTPGRAGNRKFVVRTTEPSGRLTRTPSYRVTIARPR